MPKGTRLNPKHDEHTRAKIQTSQIINRLNKLVKGEVEMTSQQVRAAEILLRKSLPDLSAVSVSGDENNPFLMKDISASPYENSSSKWLEDTGVKNNSVI